MEPGETPPSASPRRELSAAARKALQVLSQPTLEIDQHTDYARPSVPFFTDGSASSPPTVSVFVHYDWRYGSFFGDSDHWCRSTACSIPAEWFFDALGRLQPGVEIVAQGRAEIVKEDEAWGIDCLDPHNNVTREEVQIMLRLELSADMRSVTLTLLQQGTGGWLPWAQLRQRDGAAPTVVL